MSEKIIHYCWFGRGKKGKLFQKCLKSWKKFFPDYEIKEWNEDNFDVNCNDYVKEAYEKQKYAFVSDYARLKIIYENGGIYFDTDVEVIKRVDDEIISNGYLAEEENGIIATGLGFASAPRNKAIMKMMEEYNSIHFLKPNCEFDMTPCTVRNTRSLIENNYSVEPFKIVEGLTIYPPEYFCGYDIKNNSIKITEKTFTVHHYNGSWLKPRDKIKAKIRKKIAKIIGINNYEKIRKIKMKYGGKK